MGCESWRCLWAHRCVSLSRVPCGAVEACTAAEDLAKALRSEYEKLPEERKAMCQRQTNVSKEMAGEAMRKRKASESPSGALVVGCNDDDRLSATLASILKPDNAPEFPMPEACLHQSSQLSEVAVLATG